MCKKKSGKAAIGTEQRKDVTYEKLLRNFVPIAVLRYLWFVGRKIKEKTGNKNATSHIFQAISTTVQRGNATSIMGTLGTFKKT